MVLLINLLTFFIVFVLLCLLGFLINKKLYRAAFITSTLGAVLIYIIHAATPSYLPKGTVHKMNVPAFEERVIHEEDRIRMPSLNEHERQEHFDKTFDAVQRARNDGNVKTKKENQTPEE